MADSSLSQDEIDSLLSGADDIQDTLDIREYDFLNRFKKAFFSGMEILLAHKILTTSRDITSKTLALAKKKSFRKPVLVTLETSFGPLLTIILTKKNPLLLASMMSGTEQTEFTDITIPCIEEAFNMALGSALGSMSDYYKREVKGRVKIDSDLDSYEIYDCKAPLDSLEFYSYNSYFIVQKDSLFEERIAWVEMYHAPSVISIVNEYTKETLADIDFSLGSNPTVSELIEGAEPPLEGPIPLTPEVVIQRMETPILEEIPILIEVRLGKTIKKISDIMNLTVGEFIVLDDISGDTVDVCIDDRVIAQSEVVSVHDNFGVRITSISKE